MPLINDHILIKVICEYWQFRCRFDFDFVFYFYFNFCDLRLGAFLFRSYHTRGAYQPGIG